MKFVAGVDAHKDTHTVVFLDRLGLESTGCYAKAFARRLLKSGACVYEVPGSFTKRHRQRSSRTGKSDPLDAQAIGEAVLRESHRLPRYEIAIEREALRVRYDQRDRLAGQRTECINRLRAAAVRLELNLPTCLRSEKGLDETERLVKKIRG